MHGETSVLCCFFCLLGVFFEGRGVFSKCFRTSKELPKLQGLFSSSSEYYFLRKVNETLSWSSLACNIFAKVWFLFSDKSQVQKSGDVITCFFCTVKKQNFRSIQAHSWKPPSPFFQCCLSRGVWCVLVYVFFIYTISTSFSVSQEAHCGK